MHINSIRKTCIVVTFIVAITMFFSGVMSFGSVGRHNYKSRRRANINDTAYILTAGTI